jgi:hypothetical protein
MHEIESSNAASEEINRLHEENCSAARQTIERAIRIGELLAEQKERLGHEKWLPWLDTHIRFSRGTAENYRRVYERQDQIKFINVRNLTDAYRLIRDASKSSKATKDASKVKIGARDFRATVPTLPETTSANKSDFACEIGRLIRTYQSGLSEDEYYRSLEELADVVDECMEEIGA